MPGEVFSMAITARWDEKMVLPGALPNERFLTKPFSLVQGRLFVKAENTNLEIGSDTRSSTRTATFTR